MVNSHLTALSQEKRLGAVQRAFRLGYLYSGHPQVALLEPSKETFGLTVYALERYYPDLGTTVLARMDFPRLSMLFHFP